MHDEATEQAYQKAQALFAETAQIIRDPAQSGMNILAAVRRHGVAVWQIGQHWRTYDWFCTLSHKARWADVFWKAEHAASFDDAVRAAALAWDEDRESTS